MPGRKTMKGVLLTKPLTRNSHISIFTDEELEKALPRLSFFDCHAKASRRSEEIADQARRYDCKSSNGTAATNTGDISFKIFDESHSERSSSQDMTNIDNKSKTLSKPIINGTASVLNSCKIPDQNESSAKMKPSISDYFEGDSVSVASVYPNSQANNIEKIQNAHNCEKKNSTASIEDEMFYKMYESSDSMGSFKAKDSDSVLKIVKEEAIKSSENHNSKSEGFQYLMEYLLCLQNTHHDNNDEIDSLCPQMKPSDPKYFVDSLKRSASIFASQHRCVHGQMDSDLFTAAQQLPSRLIGSTRRSTNLDPSSEKYCSELAVRRHTLDQWIDRVSTSEFMKTRDEVLSILGDNSCQPWSGLHHCRYLRLPRSQLINYASLPN